MYVTHIWSLLVDYRLLEVINDPLEVIWGNLDVSVSQFLDLLLSALIHFLFELPALLVSVLLLVISWLDVFDVVVWYYLLSSWEV